MCLSVQNLQNLCCFNVLFSPTKIYTIIINPINPFFFFNTFLDVLVLLVSTIEPKKNEEEIKFIKLLLLRQMY